MRKIRLILMASLIAAAVAGCTTTSDEGQTGGSGGSTAYPPYEPPTNGVPMGEMESCEALVGAFAEAAADLQCTFTLPTCPNYIRGSGAPQCSQYDEGSILGCAEFYANFDSCDDFAKKGCQIHNIEDSEPLGCTDEDAGADAEPDAADTDAQVDGGEADALVGDGGTEPDAATDGSVVTDGGAAPDAQSDAAPAADAAAGDV